MWLTKAHTSQEAPTSISGSSSRAFGFRIQRSAFECLLTREKYKLLVERINRYAKAEDLIRIYRLNQNVVTEIYGEKLEAENENKAYYFF